MSIEFDASELRTLAADLGNVPKLAGQLAKVAVKKTAKDIEKSAKATAPRDPARPPKDPSRRVTGNLRNSIKTTDLRMVSQDSPEAEVKATANYAVFQEMGTSRMPARPFMGPAADKHTPAFEAAMAEIADRALGG